MLTGLTALLTAESTLSRQPTVDNPPIGGDCALHKVEGKMKAVPAALESLAAVCLDSAPLEEAEDAPGNGKAAQTFCSIEDGYHSDDVVASSCW